VFIDKGAVSARRSSLNSNTRRVTGTAFHILGVIPSKRRRSVSPEVRATSVTVIEFQNKILPAASDVGCCMATPLPRSSRYIPLTPDGRFRLALISCLATYIFHAAPSHCHPRHWTPPIRGASSRRIGYTPVVCD